LLKFTALVNQSKRSIYMLIIFLASIPYPSKFWTQLLVILIVVFQGKKYIVCLNCLTFCYVDLYLEFHLFTKKTWQIIHYKDLMFLFLFEFLRPWHYLCIICTLEKSQYIIIIAFRSMVLRIMGNTLNLSFVSDHWNESMKKKIVSY
jgi:hypothetical protein